MRTRVGPTDHLIDRSPNPGSTELVFFLSGVLNDPEVALSTVGDLYFPLLDK